MQQQLHRYSAKRNIRAINFYCYAPDAKEVYIVGDFNGWQIGSSPMKRQVDGTWTATVQLHHGHHQYYFLVDGKVVLDPRAHGIGRNHRNEKVSIIAVS